MKKKTTRVFSPVKVKQWIKDLKSLRINYAGATLRSLITGNLGFTETNRICRGEFLEALLTNHSADVDCTIDEYNDAADFVEDNEPKVDRISAADLRELIRCKKLLARVNARFSQARVELTKAINKAASAGTFQFRYVVEYVRDMDDPDSEKGYLIPGTYSECQDAINRAEGRRDNEEQRIDDLTEMQKQTKKTK